MINYIHLQFKGITRDQQEILIALLSDLGFEGFEENPAYLSAFIPEDQWTPELIRDTITALPVSYTTEVIAPRNWNEEWEKNFDPVAIKDFCGIRAHFHEPMENVQHEIIITPKMSFGTGHHATTHMMVEYMAELDLAGKTVLDFGTGTGVLAILAEKLGAKEIMAIDNDDWSIQNAAENIQVNDAQKIVLEKASDLQQYPSYDIILANINKHILLANMADLKQHLTTDSVLIMSGLLAGDRTDIEASAQLNGMAVIDQKNCNNWIALRITTV